MFNSDKEARDFVERWSHMLWRRWHRSMFVCHPPEYYTNRKARHSIHGLAREVNADLAREKADREAKAARRKEAAEKERQEQEAKAKAEAELKAQAEQARKERAAEAQAETEAKARAEAAQKTLAERERRGREATALAASVRLEEGMQVDQAAAADNAMVALPDAAQNAGGNQALIPRASTDLVPADEASVLGKRGRTLAPLATPSETQRLMQSLGLASDDSSSDDDSDNDEDADGAPTRRRLDSGPRA
jgi:hypothetical protein